MWTHPNLRPRWPSGVAAPALGLLCAIGVLLPRDMGVAALKSQGTTNTAPRGAIRTVRVGKNPGPLAVDAQTRRVFVVNRTVDAGGIPLGAGSVSVLDAVSGRVVRTVAVGLAPTGVVVDERTSRAFVAGAERFVDGSPMRGRVSVLDAATGAPLRTIPLAQYPTVMAIDRGLGRVFAVTGDVLSVLDATRGTLVRTVSLGVIGSGDLAVDTRRGHVVVTSYEPSRVQILTEATGRVVRTVGVGPHAGSPAVDERAGRVFVINQLNQRATVRMLDATNGTVLRTTAVGNFPGAIAVDERTARVFVLNTLSGDVSTLDARTGALVHTARVGQSPTALVVDTHAGRVLVASDTGVSVLDATKGTVLRVLPVMRENATAMALDGNAGRVFITSGRGNSVSLLDVAP